MKSSRIYKNSYFLFALLLLSCDSSEGDVQFTSKKPSPKLSYVLAVKNTLPNQLTAPGQLLPFEQVTIFSEISGYIEEILFQEGEHVTKGQALIRINSERISADIKQLEVDLALAQKEAERQEALSEVAATSTELLEQTQSRVAQINAQLNRLTIEIEKSTIRAPFSGQMGLRQISPGAYITPNQAIVSLAQINPLKVEFAIPQRYATAVHINDTIEVTQSNTNEKFIATVFAKEPYIDQSTKTLTIRAKLDATKNLYPGAFVNVTVALETNEQGVLIPSEALMPVLNGQKVWVKRNNLAVSELVTPGVRTSDRIVIAGNIKVGDTILTTGLLGIREGMAVEVRD